MDTYLEYLRSFLEDEFKDYEGVRIRLTPPTVTSRSPDLAQDYSEEDNDLHKERGVIVIASNREYYFPSDWAKNKNFSEIQSLSRKIKDKL